jgi:preprotein translocase subunit SecA
MMAKLGVPEDQPIENSFISNTLENAQAKIEGFHFDSRKHTLEYDNVMNHQRKVVYERRRIMLSGDYGELENFLNSLASEYSSLEEVIRQKRAALGDSLFFETIRRIALYTTDTLWVEHLETMDHTRLSVNLRAYGQREPLVEYKKEGLRLFKEMEINFKEKVFSLINTINIDNKEERKQEVVETRKDLILSSSDGENSHTTIRSEKKVGRNDPCSCGSGKKYKVCHGKDK